VHALEKRGREIHITEELQQALRAVFLIAVIAVQLRLYPSRGNYFNSMFEGAPLQGMFSMEESEKTTVNRGGSAGCKNGNLKFTPMTTQNQVTGNINNRINPQVEHQIDVRDSPTVTIAILLTSNREFCFSTGSLVTSGPDAYVVGLPVDFKL